MPLLDDLRVDLGDDDGVIPSGVPSHNLLSPSHGDTVTDSPSIGDLITGGADWFILSSGSAGQVLTIINGQLGWSSTQDLTMESHTLIWGNDTIGSTTTPRYLTPGFDNNLAPTTPVQFRSTRTLILRNMHVVINDPRGNGSGINFTLRVASTPTALSVTAASTSPGGSDLVNSISVPSGSLMDIEVTKFGIVAQSPRDITLSIEAV